MRGQSGFFDVDERLKRLSDLGDQLLAFAAAVDFEMFRAELTRALAYSDGSQGGRPPFDPVLMFKVLVVQATNNLSDERAEFLINDRLSFMRFLGLGLADRVPDARTIWLFREKLTHAGAIKPLFDRFNAALREAGYIAMGGQIIDATLIAAPKQRNTEEEKTAIKEGRIPEDWKAKPAKLRQKDRDARWTVKFSKAKERADGSKPAVDIAIPTFGYQNHVSIDRQYGLIRRGTRPTRRLTRARGYARDCSTRPTPRAWCGRTRAIDRRSTRSSSPRTASSVAFTERSLLGGRCPRRCGAPMRSSPRSAHASSTSSRCRKTK